MWSGPAATQAFLAAFILQASLAAPAASQEGPGAAGPAIRIELNALQPTEGGCRFTFVATNGLETDISKAAYEVVLFDTAGVVERLTVLDFQDLPAGRTRVRQFALRNADCEKISRVLVNDATACEGEGLDPAVCSGRLETSTRSAVVFSG